MKSFGKNGSHILVLDLGEKVVQTITEWAARNRVQSGAISGVGALMDVELGFYKLHEKEYLRRTFNDEYELLSLNGNITLKDGTPFVHVHTVLGDIEFGTWGGHMFEARVAVTAEITITPIAASPRRELNDRIGLALICGDEPERNAT